MIRPSHALALVTTLALAVAAPAAHADETSPDKAACVARLDKAQILQSGHKLKDARASLLVCSNDACPQIVREDCARSLVELDASMPSAVFSATLDGADVDDVKVMIDGELAADKLDGRSIAVDPGTHVARFLRDGRPAVEVKFVAREGEKNRLVAAALGIPRAEARAPAKLEGSKKSVLLPVLLAGTGTLALGGALGLRLSADSKADDMRSTCAPACDPGARDSLSDRLVMSNVSLAIGIGALATAAVVWLVDR
jgi:hypothetical protein